jgi:DNA-binding NtrC family response regulator
VSSGEEALEQFRSDERAFDIVITDLSMPGMDGLALIKLLRSLRPELPVILTTGYADRLAAYEARKIGVTEVLLKPNDLDSLSDAVTRALRRVEHSDVSSRLEESHP